MRVDLFLKRRQHSLVHAAHAFLGIALRPSRVGGLALHATARGNRKLGGNKCGGIVGNRGHLSSLRDRLDNVTIAAGLARFQSGSADSWGGLS